MRPASRPLAIVQVGPAVCSLQALIRAPAASATSFAPDTSAAPAASLAKRIVTVSNAAGAAFASAAVKVSACACARRYSFARRCASAAAQLRVFPPRSPLSFGVPADRSTGTASGAAATSGLPYCKANVRGELPAFVTFTTR